MRLSIIAVALALAIGGAVQAADPQPTSDPWISKLAGREELERALKEGIALPPSRAVATVAAFSGIPNPDVSAFEFGPEPSGARSIVNPFYEIRVDTDPGSGTYVIDATDGLLSLFRSDEPVAENVDPQNEAVGEAQAEALVRRYLQEKLPWTTPRKWYEWTAEKRDAGHSWHFAFMEELPPHNARLSLDLYIEVRKCDGHISTVMVPPHSWIGPVTPRISRPQAEKILLAHAWDGESPHLPVFNEVYLSAGTPTLKWIFVEITPIDPDPEARNDHDFRVHSVDALTGAYSPESLAPSRVVPRVPTTALPKLTDAQLRRARADAEEGRKLSRPAPYVWLRHGEGDPNPLDAPPLERDGEVWLRAVVFRNFGARVIPLSGRLRIWSGKEARRFRSRGERELGAVFRENEWWVPLRVAATAMGWQVRWDPKRRLATVITQDEPADNCGSLDEM